MTRSSSGARSQTVLDRFAFGRNWTSFLAAVDEPAIAAVQQAMPDPPHFAPAGGVT